MIQSLYNWTESCVCILGKHVHILCFLWTGYKDAAKVASLIFAYDELLDPYQVDFPDALEHFDNVNQHLQIWSHSSLREVRTPFRFLLKNEGKCQTDWIFWKQELRFLAVFPPCQHLYWISTSPALVTYIYEVAPWNLKAVQEFLMHANHLGHLKQIMGMWHAKEQLKKQNTLTKCFALFTFQNDSSRMTKRRNKH